MSPSTCPLICPLARLTQVFWGCQGLNFRLRQRLVENNKKPAFFVAGYLWLSVVDNWYAGRGPFAGYFAVDSINYQTTDLAAGVDADDIDDSLTVTFGGNYDFEVLKLFAGAQYFDEAKVSSAFGLLGATDYNDTFSTKFKGWSLGVSANIPVAGGSVLVGAGYMDAEAADSQKTADKDELTRWVVSAGYYPLSKRTNVYGILTYAQDSMEYTSKVEDQDPTVFAAMVGIRHRF